MSAEQGEKERQQLYTWQRSANYATYNRVLGDCIAQSCMDAVPSGSVLDLACGDGTIARHFADHYERVVGVDASSHHLDKAVAAVHGATFHESLIEDFSTDERFDGVFLICLLEHVEDPKAILQKAASFLKAGGRLVVFVPNANAVNRHIAVEMGTLEALTELSPFDVEIAGHRRSYTLETLRAQVVDAGLQVSRTGGVFYKMLSTPQIDWLLEHGPWQGNQFGWGRVGAEPRDWRAEFCRACYELGKSRPNDCNVIYACIGKE